MDALELTLEYQGSDEGNDRADADTDADVSGSEFALAFFLWLGIAVDNLTLGSRSEKIVGL